MRGPQLIKSGTLELGGPLVLAGAGKMGHALLAGWLEQGLDPASVAVLDPAPSPEVARFLAGHGIEIRPPDVLLMGPPAVLVLAVKPQVMDSVTEALGPQTGPDTVVLSIAAGRSLASLAAHFPQGTAIVRAMPNTAAAIGRGITVCCANGAVSAGGKEVCTALIAAAGEVIWIDDEALMDAVTAVSGSGPAYVFLLAEYLADAGIAAGLDSATARRLARVTISGAGELLHRSGEDPAALRRNVTSPGGTTAAALQVLMGDDGLKRLMTTAVEAAVKRGRELGG